ncbi:Ig-like domain repeat protein [Streptomyces sp. RY43-2]|uniref:Ig-like domain repeat protein n=1 Tax=Streptomyces macrolidinus TaxID=2952607 RepID=A0ABT0ZJ35_9ACTN|nr:Ig-like domain repeat protein [Streptomyces macrolidinus]MCN9243590.1 Ig-like domain repeat protein [Streptomyces macrolidinus]
MKPQQGGRARAALAALVAALVAALCLTGLAAPSASAQQSPPTDIALAWGYNEFGQLGDGTTTDRTTPVNVHLPAGTQLTAIAGGFFHSLALTSDGRVLAWGDNSAGDLGDSTTVSSSTPVEVHLPAGTQATAIAGGGLHSLAVTSDGRVFAWGLNNVGQLGDGTTTSSSTPVEVHLPAGVQATAVAAGQRHSLALTSDGRVFAWGDNGSGQLGDGTTTNRLTPVEVHLPAGTQATAISGGFDHSLALTPDGRVLAWGDNGFGQLGDGTTTSSSTPVEVLLPAGTRATAIAGNNGYHSLAVTSDGRVLAWGRNGLGQLGDGTTVNSSTPVEVLLPVGTQATAVATGYDHSLALTSDGRVLAWGNGRFGELGDGTTASSSTPVETLLPAGVHATAIAAGNYHSLALAVRAASTTTLTASPTTAAPGQPVTLTAHVTCTSGTPTGGEVIFFDGTTQIGTATVDAQGNATLTTTDLGVGTHEITAHFQGMGDCPASVSEPVTVTVAVVPVASLTLDKRVVSEGPFRVGDRVEYAYMVTNTGNTELHNVTVTDDLVTQVTCDTTTLAPGQSTTCHGSHTITRADVTPCKQAKERGGDKGKGHGKHQVMRCEVTNTAHATATDPTGLQVTSNEATATIIVKVEKKREKEKEHCRKHHGGHKKVYGGDRCDDHDGGHHHRVAEDA